MSINASQVVLVTGGASGIGKAIASRLCSEGAQVVITDIQAECAAETADSLGVFYLQQDVRHEARWKEVIDVVEDRYGCVNVLVNNAGIAGPMDAASPESTALQAWQDVFRANVESVFLGCRAVLPAMRRCGGGSIINISSIAALMATPYATAYGASKAAVRQLTKSVAQYCAEQRLAIRCNSVHPGDVRTPLWERYAKEAAAQAGISLDEFIAREKASVPLGDFTRAEDVAAAVAYLASEDARHVTGTHLIVDGGVVNCETFRG